MEDEVQGWVCGGYRPDDGVEEAGVVRVGLKERVGREGCRSCNNNNHERSQK